MPWPDLAGEMERACVRPGLSLSPKVAVDLAYDLTSQRFLKPAQCFTGGSRIDLGLPRSQNFHSHLLTYTRAPCPGGRRVHRKGEELISTSQPLPHSIPL